MCDGACLNEEWVGSTGEKLPRSPQFSSGGPTVGNPEEDLPYGLALVHEKVAASFPKNHHVRLRMTLVGVQGRGSESREG